MKPDIILQIHGLEQRFSGFELKRCNIGESEATNAEKAKWRMQNDRVMKWCDEKEDDNMWQGTTVPPDDASIVISSFMLFAFLQLGGCI